MTPKLYLDLGIKLASEGEYEDAVIAFCKAIELNPNYSAAYNNLGLVLQYSKQRYEAEACFRRAIDLSPEDPHAYNNLGLVLIDLGYWGKAEICLRRALELHPSHPAIWNNLGTVLEETYRLDEAEESYRRAVELEPTYSEGHYNLGTLLRVMNRLREAEVSISTAIELRPDYLGAVLALAHLYLLQGNFEKGWEIYEQSRPTMVAPGLSNIPKWQGENLEGRTILLFWEYGFGDTIQFARYIPEIRKRAANIAVIVQKPLDRWIRKAYPGITVFSDVDAAGEQYDYICSLLSLPAILRTRQDTILPVVPFKGSNSPTVSAWTAILEQASSSSDYRVGVVWAGHPRHLNDEKRSIPFEIFQTLFKVQQITWVSLQVGSRKNDLKETSHEILDFSNELVDFMETARLIESLSLVITVDTAVAHLAGSLGKKTWVLLSADADWRWQKGREDSPWYSTIRLFRQQTIGAWLEVLQRVVTALYEEMERD